MLFPHTLPGAAEARKHDIDQAYAHNGNIVDEAGTLDGQIGFGNSWSECKRSLKVYFKEIIYY